MLSIENPPPDPPCPCQVPLLNNPSFDERASTSHTLAFSEVDLQSKNPPPPSLPPNFSIREYVFKARSKNIQTNWPFSVKNLQLCLKHGVKDLLPPFQHPDTVRTQLSNRCKVEAKSLSKRSISNWERREQPSSRPNSDLPSFDSDVNSNSHRDTVASCKDISSLKSGGEDDNPLITTSAVSGSQIEPVSTSRQPSSVVETDALVESSVRKDKEATSRKAVSTSQPSGKKCRLIVKFGGKCERSSTEDISSNCTSISEAMASKVCPVCKTFSSSSNTTLNAHIDQCLSIESSPKQAADKLIRPRIKPRKIKLMADIYLKAPRCTLEELDRRNGSNWAGVSCLPRDAEPTAEGKKKTSSVVNGDGANDAGAVYIDANGTKLRILSKFNDAPLVPQVQDDLGLKRSLRGSKGRKAFAKKRRLHGSKHHKYLKVSSKGKKIHPRKAHELQVTGNHKKQNTLQEVSVGSQRQISRSQGLMKPGDSGSLRTWASSKRTGLAKKAATREFPPPRCHLHLAQNLLVESGQPCLGNNLTMDGGLQKSTCLSDQQMNEGKEKAVEKTQMTDETEQSPGRKGLGSMLDGRTGDITERSLPPAKRKFRKDNSLGDDGSPLLSLLDNSEHCSLQPVRNKKLGLHASPDSDYGISRNMSVRSLRNSRAFSRKALRFSTLRKRVLSLCQSPEMNSKSNRIEKCSHFEKSNMLLAREMGEKVAALQPKLQRRYDVGLDPAEHQSAGEDSLDDMSFSERMIGQERGERSPLHREEATAFRSTPSASDCFDDIEGENMHSSFAVCARLPQRIDGIKSNPNEVNNDVNGANVPSALAMEDASWGLSRYFSSEYDNHMNSRFKTHSQRLLGTSKASLFTDGEEFSNAEDDDNCATEQNGNDRIDEDSEDGQASSFPEIDPIPIPGPPGSFLPSPGAMGSEDFQGNSSLTTSQVHSSQEQQDLVDGDSSDSPVSATSTISNSAENRVDVDCSERVVPHEHQNSSWSGFLGTCNEPSVNDVAATAQASTEVVESNAEDAEKSRVGNRFIKKGPLFSTIDDQPCCCQRKERLSQNIALSYRESPHTNRRMMAPLAVPGMMGKQFGRSPYAGLAQLEGRPETLNPAGYMSTKSERSSSPTTYSSRDPVSSPDDRFNCPGRGDCDLASPSASNPILRLMGKDLVVVNKEEDASVPLGQSESQSGAQKNNPSPQFSLYSGVLSAGGQNQKYGLSDHLVIQGSKIMREDLNGMGEPHFGAGAVSSSISFMNSKTARVPPSPFATPQRLVDGFTEAQDYNGGCSSSTLCQPVDVPNAFTVHNQVRIVSFPETQPQKASSPGNLRKEIIVIDDAPENNEADLLKSPEILRDHMPLSRTFGCDPRQANSFFPPHQPQDPLYYSGYPADFSARSNANPVASSHNAKGLMPPQAAPFTAASSSRGHLRPGIVYYPSMS